MAPGKRHLWLGFSVFSLVCFFAAAKASAETIKIGGSGGALGTVRLLAEAFKKEQTSIDVVIVPGLGAGGARKAVLAGALEIGVTSRVGNRPENVSGALAREYGKAPLVFMTSNQNPVSNITTQELLEIYSGNRTTWSTGDRLRLILRPESDADTELLKGMSPEMERAVKNALSREGIKIAVTDQDSADAVEQTPGGFGVSSLPLIIAEKRSLKALSVNGVIPSGKTIAEGSYPWFKTYYVLTKAELAAPSKHFVDFVLSPRARKILLSLGYWLPDVKGNQ